MVSESGASTMGEMGPYSPYMSAISSMMYLLPSLSVIGSNDFMLTMFLSSLWGLPIVASATQGSFHNLSMSLPHHIFLFNIGES